MTDDKDIVAVDVRALQNDGQMAIETYDHREIMVSVKLAKEILPCGKNCSTVELATFLCWCQANKLDPIRRQAHLIKYKPTEPAAYVVSYWVFVERAQRHPQFDGMETGVIWGVDGKKVRGTPCDFIADAKHVILGGWATVYRKDRDHPFDVEVPWSEMAKYKAGGQLTRNWAQQTTTMATKVPLSRALRLAFAEELGSQYTDAEFRGPDEMTPDERARRLEESLAAAEGEPNVTITDARPEDADPPGAADPGSPPAPDPVEPTSPQDGAVGRGGSDEAEPPWETPG